ncbi:MAG: response regulator [Myxococcales bacterium]|nr:response regulator [Myxococcales bacterium]
MSRPGFFVLVVEDEPIARMTHLGAISRLNDVVAIGAGGVMEALAIIAQRSPQVVVLDLQLQDGTGIDVMARLAEISSTAVLIIVSSHIERFRQRLKVSERLHLLNKPASLRDLQRIIESVQRASTQHAPFSPLDYVQLACMGQHSVEIDCVGEELCGEIVIHKGVLWSAQDELGSGVAAFTRLVLSKRMLLRVSPAREDPGPQSIEESWEQLVLDAVREQDETDRVRPPRPAAAPSTEVPAPSTEVPAPSTEVPASSTEVPAPSQPVGSGGSKHSVPSAAIDAAASSSMKRGASRGTISPELRASFDQFVDRGVRAVIERNYPLAISEFEQAQALWPDEPLVRHRLQRLRMMVQPASS